MLESRPVADKFVESCNLLPESRVIEIGTGRGILTEKLALTSKSITSFEIDKQLFEQARDRFARCENVELVYGDAFASELAEKRFDVCITSLPYSQSLRFLKWCAKRKNPFNLCAAIVQLEFAYKLTSASRLRSYRAASVIAQISFRIETIFRVSRQEFKPPPNVDSIAIHLYPNENRKQPFFNDNRLRILDFIFSFRGRRFSSVLKKIVSTASIQSIPQQIGETRIEAITPEEYSRILPILERSVV